MESKEIRIEPVPVQPQDVPKPPATETATYTNSAPDVDAVSAEEHQQEKKWWSSIKEPGSALQIITSAVCAIGIGLGVSTAVDEVPESARVILSIPGDLWLRSLKAVGECRRGMSYRRGPIN